MHSDDAAKCRFAELLKRHRGIVLKVAYAYAPARSQQDRDDLAQEICTQLWRSFRSFDAEREFSTWMYRIALNVAISWLRAAGARRSGLPVVDTGFGAIASADAECRLESDERLAALRGCIEQQGPLDRALLLLYLDERPYREIAEVLGITETNVATKVGRLKERLRRELAPHGPGEAVGRSQAPTAPGPSLASPFISNGGTHGTR